MPSCTHDYSASNQYFVTSAPGRAKTRRSGRFLSAAEREDAGTADWDAWEAEYDAREEEMFRMRYGTFNTNKCEHISPAEEKEKQEAELRKELKKQFKQMWHAFEQSKHPIAEKRDVMDKLRRDVEKLYQPPEHKEFEQKQAAARVLEKTKPVAGKKQDPDPFAMSPAAVHRR